MGAADREARRPGPHGTRTGSISSQSSSTTRPTARPTTSWLTQTLWYCHHHLFDLPHPAPVRPLLARTAWEGYRAYNRAMADVIVAARPGQGEAVFVQDYHSSLLGSDAGRGRARLRTGTSAHPLRRARRCSASCPTTWRPELLDGMAGYGACGFHCRRGRPISPRCYAAAGRPRRHRPSWPRSAPMPTRWRDEASSRPAPRRPTALRAEVGGRAHYRPDRPHGAFQEHRARHARFRGAADRPPRVARARWCTWRSPIPCRQGLAEYLAYAADVEHMAEADQPRLPATDGWTPIVLLVKTTGPARSPC